MFRVGDKVWEIRRGWGEVKKIEKYEELPITVGYNDGYYRTYTEDGKVHDCDANRSLFFKEIVIPKQALDRPRFRAEEGIQYVVVTCTGTLNYYTERLSWTDEEYYSCGNYFETEEEAKESDLYKVYNR
ncbi:MAG: hypothetical protein ACRC6E_09780 [Fusobacteriaceae bacterium]